MIVKILEVKKREVDIDDVMIRVPVREDDDMPEDYPGRFGNEWTAHVYPNTGQIKRWLDGFPSLNLCLKVTNQGTYVASSGDDVIVAVEQDYVPSWIPNEFGDYIELDISSTGRIQNWNPKDFASALEDYNEEKEQQQFL